jgi:hypothetical protein
MKLVNEWTFGELRDVFRAPAPTTNRHRGRPRSADPDPDGERFCEEWLAHRVWEDDGGRVHSDPASSVAG